MNTKRLLPLLGLAAGFLLVGAACSKSSTDTTTNTVITENSNIATGSSVSISGLAFSNPTLTVKIGTAVTWTNNDTTTHTVTSTTGSELGSSPLAPGGTYSHTFTAAGTYNYHCTFHPTMTGTVIVE